MKKVFSTSLIGYNKREVDRYLEELTRDYEEELRKKRDRMMELAEEARNLKQQNQEQSERIERFTHQEQYISRALINAEQRAQAIIEEGQLRSQEEIEKLKSEKEKWRRKFREVRSELLEFERTLVSLIEKFRDEINYYTAKEISDTILMEGETVQTGTTDLASLEGALNKEKNKEKVIA
ncbi:MAG: DivIVA domain-containing protein [Caldicoprobacterales bacterium]|jgi:cell division initiation protein|nr:DivIVA domain-containing protein [Clostridiales bacterium]